VKHAREVYPNECCGAMLGSIDGDGKLVLAALPLENAFDGAQTARYDCAPKTCWRPTGRRASGKWT